MGASCRRLVVAALAGTASCLAASPAEANHIAGATYTGTHSANGAVEFTVSSDGTRIDSFRITNIPSGSCTGNEARSQAGQTVPIAADHTFTWESGGALGSFFKGSFPSSAAALGTVKITPSPVQLACLTMASQTWTARTSAAPPRSPPASPSPPASAFAPSFAGGADRVSLVRGAKGISVRAKFRICEGTLPMRLAVRQRRRVGKTVVAEARFQQTLRGPRPAPRGCRDFITTWRLASRFFGPGFVVITLRVVDAAGKQSGAPQYALRAPKR